MKSKVSFLFHDAFHLAKSRRRSLILMIGATLGITTIAGLGSFIEKSYVAQANVQVRVAKPNEFVTACPNKSWYDHPEQAKAAVSDVGSCTVDFMTTLAFTNPVFYNAKGSAIDYEIPSTAYIANYSLQNEDQTRFLGRFELIGDLSGFVPTTALLDAVYPGRPYSSCLGLKMTLDEDALNASCIVEGVISGYFQIIPAPPSIFPDGTFYIWNWRQINGNYVLHAPLANNWAAKEYYGGGIIRYQFDHALSSAEFQKLRVDTGPEDTKNRTEIFSYEEDMFAPQPFLDFYLPMIRWFLGLLLLFAGCAFPLVSGLILWDERKDIKARYGFGTSRRSQLALMTLQGGCLILPCWVAGGTIIGVFALIATAIWQSWCLEVFLAPFLTILGVLAGEMV